MQRAHRDCHSADIADDPDVRRQFRVAAPAVLFDPPSQHARIGRLDAEVRSFPVQRTVQFTANTATVHLLVPLSGGIAVGTRSETQLVSQSSALLIAKRETTARAGTAGSSALILHIPRSHVQIAAAHATGMPCRLASANYRLNCSEASGFGQAIGRLLGQFRVQKPIEGADNADISGELLTALVEALMSAGLAANTFPVARSVERVIAHVRDDPQADCSDRELARIAGITILALQRNFRECFGIPIAQFVQQTRLDLAHERLASACESRSITQLAADLGFTSAAIFARAYQRRFGEIPSQTRIRAVRG
ncbi:AraC family transcriptional regulator [Sphingomonadaceae bacterium jetA1]|jgi:AraC-like DNA-binding protein|uniref:AraC family transcriptional regulator n=1 Tax=Facivitalis istanbulensis TaxID=3075838 RepID=UPI00347C0CE6